jgi:hypothetical protein
MRSELKARSAECKQSSPANEGELYREKQKGWVDENILVVVPEQRVRLPNRLITALIEIGDLLYRGKKNGKN